MSDERLRALERTWRATATLQDEAALLLEHARAGPGTAAQREVAACLGQAFSTLPPVEATTWRPVDDGSEGLAPWDAWAQGLAERSREARGRLLLAPASAAYEAWCRGRSFARNEWVTDVLWSIEERVTGVRTDGFTWSPAFDAAYEIRGEDPPTLEQAAEAVGYAGRVWRRVPDRTDALLAFRQAAAAADGLRILGRLREEVVPWALGLRDVVAERVTARRASGEA